MWHNPIEQRESLTFQLQFQCFPFQIFNKNPLIWIFHSEQLQQQRTEQCCDYLFRSSIHGMHCGKIKALCICSCFLCHPPKSPLFNTTTEMFVFIQKFFLGIFSGWWRRKERSFLKLTQNPKCWEREFKINKVKNYKCACVNVYMRVWVRVCAFCPK